MKKSKEVEENPANVIFVGKKMLSGELVKGEPFDHYNTATGKVNLPPAEEQLKGFYFEKAADLIKLFPDHYKPLVSKG